MSAGDTAETMDEIVDARGGESPIPAKQGDPSQDTQSQISEDDVSKSTLEQNGEENGATPAVNNSDPGGIAENLNTTKEVISRSGDECADEDSAFQIQQKHTTDAELSEVIGSENITERSNEQLVVEETAKEISASQEEINEDTSAENKELPETHEALSEANKESSEATLTEAFENEEKSLIENDDSFQKPEIEMSENQEVQNNESSVERPNVQELATEDTGEDNLDQVTAEMKESSDEPPREENEADLNLNSPLQVAAEEDTSNKKETSSDNITEENAMQESSNLLDKRDEESACMADLYSEKPESPQNEPAETDKNTDTKDTEKSESHVDGSDSGNLDGIQISTVSGAGDSEDVVMSQEGSSEDAGKVSENAEGGETTTEVATDIPEASDDTTKVAEVSENVSEVAGDGSKEGTTENTEKISEIPKEDEEAPSAMETEDSGSLGAMVISEPRTVSEEVMEVEQGEVTSKENPESMEVDKSSEPAPEPLEKVSEGDDKQKEGANQAEAKESASNKVENLLSENDGLGFKIVSVSAATDTTGATEEITVEDDAGKTDATSESKDKPEVEKTHQEKGKADESEADKPKEDTGPKIVATTSLSESPQRVTRSQTGSTPPAPPAAAPQPSAKLPQTCIVCKKVGKCKYNIVRNGDVKHLCNDKCFKEFRSMPTKFLRADSVAKSTPTPPKPAPAPAKASSPLSKYKTCTVCQLMNINAAKPFLCWSSMDFCGEECLGRYKKQMKSTCGQCSKVLPPSQRATFCLKVGTDVKQFCNSECYLTFKGNRKSCPWCKKDVPSNTKEQLKGYCSLSCKEKHENLDEDEDIAIIGVETKLEVPCAVCSKVTKPKHELTFEGKLHKMCSDPCYSAFQYANKLTSNTCDNCGVYCYGEGSSPQFIQFEGHQKRFCSTNCVNTFRSANKKMVQCAWCGSRKTNFDMIERVDANNKYQLFCSLNCLSLYRVNLQATSNQSVTCDQCRKFVPAQYHLTMSDASVRNFCSYSCVMTFQGQFGAGSKQGLKKPTANTANATTPAATPNKNAAPANRAVTNGPKVNETQTKTPTRANVPPPAAVAASTPTAVQSPQVRAQTVNIRSPAQIPVVVQSQQQAAKTMMTKGTQQQIIIQPPPPKQVKNKSLLCKPYVQTKATSCRPSTLSKETQTDVEAKPDEKPIFIPVPVPIYIPTPMAMYSAPTPVPLPFPVPIPIPCFIPTTKKNADSILKHIKEIREKIPDDPFEAELLRMAEAVANADKPSDDDDSDNDAPMEDTPNDAASVSEKTGETEEDMLQIALRMATEMTAPTDLETAVDPLPITDSPAPEPAAAPDTEEEEEEPPVETPRTLRRGRNRKTPKRGSSSRGSRRSKRQKIDTEEEVSESQDDSIVARSASPAVAPPAPDANFLLKYMYGVNAWKHWVVQKNAQLEKVIKQGSGRVKLFKTELLQCVADELNYSLCLFVKEVRKPNGDEYAADSILYLCLGIQNYLFENGRIDNIFTDIYYEKFTECLNEVVQRFKPKLNTAGQLVCRIEEEHLWECKQLGAHSPYVLLNTLVYFNTKHFMLRTPEDHMKLSFSHIMKHWKKSGGTRDPGPKGVGGRSVYLRYCVPASAKAAGGGDNKKNVALEQAENLENPLRCPVKLYEFYLSKCSYFTSPESIKTRNDIFYLVPERSCVPDSPVWYSTQPMTIEPMAKMLNRIHLVKEIQEAYMKEF